MSTSARPSMTPFQHDRGPSPTKRRRLTATPSGSRTLSSASSTAPARLPSTPLDDREYEAARRASTFRVLAVWNALEHRYAKGLDEDDIVDLGTEKIVQDRGVIAGRAKVAHIGTLLEGTGGEDEEEDDGTSEGAGEEEENDTEGAETDELAIVSEGDGEYEDQNDGADPQNPQFDLETEPEPDDDEGSQDELDLWNDEDPSEGALLGQERGVEIPTRLSSLTYQFSAVRPKLEELARARSPLPMEDLEAFLAAEAQFTRDGYQEPEIDLDAIDDDEIVILSSSAYTSGQEEEEEVEEERLSDAEREEGNEEEDSGDELNDWATPAPEFSYADDEAISTDQSVDDPLIQTLSPTASEAEENEPLEVRAIDQPGPPPQKELERLQLFTPPYSNRSATTPNIPRFHSTPAVPKSDTQACATSSRPTPAPSPIKRQSSTIKTQETKDDPPSKTSRAASKPLPSTFSRTPSKLIPEVVIPPAPWSKNKRKRQSLDSDPGAELFAPSPRKTSGELRPTPPVEAAATNGQGQPEVQRNKDHWEVAVEVNDEELTHVEYEETQDVPSSSSPPIPTAELEDEAEDELSRPSSPRDDSSGDSHGEDDHSSAEEQDSPPRYHKSRKHRDKPRPPDQERSLSAHEQSRSPSPHHQHYSQLPPPPSQAYPSRIPTFPPYPPLTQPLNHQSPYHPHPHTAPPTTPHHESLLAQVLQSLNYLAHQGLPGNTHPHLPGTPSTSGAGPYSHAYSHSYPHPPYSPYQHHPYPTTPQHQHYYQPQHYAPPPPPPGMNYPQGYEWSSPHHLPHHLATPHRSKSILRVGGSGHGSGHGDSGYTAGNHGSPFPPMDSSGSKWRAKDVVRFDFGEDEEAEVASSSPTRHHELGLNFGRRGAGSSSRSYPSTKEKGKSRALNEDDEVVEAVPPRRSAGSSSRKGPSTGQPEANRRGRRAAQEAEAAPSINHTRKNSAANATPKSTVSAPHSQSRPRKPKIQPRPSSSSPDVEEILPDSEEDRTSPPNRHFSPRLVPRQAGSRQSRAKPTHRTPSDNQGGKSRRKPHIQVDSLEHDPDHEYESSDVGGVVAKARAALSMSQAKTSSLGLMDNLRKPVVRTSTSITTSAKGRK